MVSYHAHHGPVKFLVTATAILRTDQDKPRDSPAPGADPPDGDDKAALPREGAGPCACQGGPATQLRGSQGSSSSGSLIPVQGSSSLEPRSEGSATHDLLRHPDVPPGRGWRARRAKASSVLVACGGQGHRRVSRKARPQRPEELASSIMVWQIPLLNV